MDNWKPILQIYILTILYSSLLATFIGFFSILFQGDLDLLNALACGGVSGLICFLASALLSLPFFISVGVLYYIKKLSSNNRLTFFLLHSCSVLSFGILFYLFDSTAWQIPLLFLFINMVVGAFFFSRKLGIRFWLFK